MLQPPRAVAIRQADAHIGGRPLALAKIDIQVNTGGLFQFFQFRQGVGIQVLGRFFPGDDNPLLHQAPAAKGQGQEQGETDDQVEPQRRHIARPPAGHELGGQEAGTNQQRDQGAPDPRIPGEELPDQFRQQVRETQVLAGIALAALAAIVPGQCRPAVEAVAARLLFGHLRHRPHRTETGHPSQSCRRGQQNRDPRRYPHTGRASLPYRLQAGGVQAARSSIKLMARSVMVVMVRLGLTPGCWPSA